jgi:hypothetical protein
MEVYVVLFQRGSRCRCMHRVTRRVHKNSRPAIASGESSRINYRLDNPLQLLCHDLCVAIFRLFCLFSRSFGRFRGSNWTQSRKLGHDCVYICGRKYTALLCFDQLFRVALVLFVKCEVILIIIICILAARFICKREFCIFSFLHLQVDFTN